MGGALLAALIGLTGLSAVVLPHAVAGELVPSGLAWLGGLYPLGLAAAGLDVFYLVGLCLGAYLHAARGAPFGLGLLWACALSVVAFALLASFSVGTSLLPAALVALTAATAGTFDAEASELAV